MGIFNALFDETQTQERLEKVTESIEKKQADNTLMARGHFLNISCRRRIQINKALNFTEKYKLAMELIRDLTGDELFYQMHMKDIGAIAEDEESIKIAMQEAVVLDATRRMGVHEHRYRQEKNLLNEFMYENALIDVEMLAIEKQNYKNLEDYEQAMEKKMLEKQSLIEIYRNNAAKGVDENVS